MRRTYEDLTTWGSRFSARLQTASPELYKRLLESQQRNPKEGLRWTAKKPNW